jgi:long-chain acyl-CoA synthetase
VADRFEYPQGPVDNLVRSAARAAPDRVAVRGTDGELTFAELDARVDAGAVALLDGIAGPGSTVALASPLVPSFVTAFHAVLRAGAYVAPINPFMRAAELRHLLDETSAETAVLTPELVTVLGGIRHELPALRTVLVLGPAQDGTPSFDELVDGYLGRQPGSRPSFGQDDVACLQFTSGTTGAPKAARLTHRNLMVNAAHASVRHEVTDDSVVFNFLPKYHLLHMNSALRGRATQVLYTEAERIVASVAAANRAGATHYYSIPMRLARLAAAPELSILHFTDVRVIACGGSALPPGAAEKLAAQFRVPVVQGYGLAETAALTHSGGPSVDRPGSVGQLLPDTSVRIVDLDSGTVLGTGERGEIQVRGPQVMAGYVQARDDAPAFTPDGWLPTGDIGLVDEDGYLFLVDRIKDVFKCDNFMVSPTEIEHALRRRPEVRDCLVVDVPDTFSGAVAGALVALVPRPGIVPEKAQEIVDEVNGELPYYKQLRHVEVVTEIPRAAMGKPDRKRARAVLTGQADG